MSVTKAMVGPRTTAICFETLASWVEALHGHGEVSAALEEFVLLFKCDAVILVRFAEGARHPNCLARAVSIPQQAFPPRVALPFAQDMLGEHLGIAKSGAVWTHSDVDDRAMWKNSDTLNERMELHSVRDLALVALGSRGGTWDFLELQFATYISTNERNLIELLAKSLAKTWHSRLPGLALKLQHLSRFNRSRATAEVCDVAIPDVENPAGLSRCEYRICSLVQEGMAAKKIAAKLDIQESTVRSHLHSIYSKTETSGQMELLHRLSSEQFGHGAPAAIVA